MQCEIQERKGSNTNERKQKKQVENTEKRVGTKGNARIIRSSNPPNK